MAASVISLEIFRDQQAEQAFRSRVHQYVDTFLDRWEARMASQEAPSPSLLRLTQAVRQERATLTGEMVGAYVEKGYGAYLHQEYAPCPVCGVLLKARPSSQSHSGDVDRLCDVAAALFLLCGLCKGFLPVGRGLESVARYQAV